MCMHSLELKTRNVIGIYQKGVRETVESTGDLYRCLKCKKLFIKPTVNPSALIEVIIYPAHKKP